MPAIEISKPIRLSDQVSWLCTKRGMAMADVNVEWPIFEREAVAAVKQWLLHHQEWARFLRRMRMTQFSINPETCVNGRYNLNVIAHKVRGA